MTYYNLFKHIPIFNFFEPVETGDLRYILILDNYNILPEIDAKLASRLKEKYEEFTDEYEQFANKYSSDIHEMLDSQVSALNLMNKKTRLEVIIYLLKNYKYSNYKIDAKYLEEELIRGGYQLNYNNKEEFKESIDKINLKGIDYRIELRQKEIEDIKKREEKKTKQTYRGGILMFEEVLNINIDIYKKTMADYMEYRKRYEEKVKHIEKLNTNKVA